MYKASSPLTGSRQITYSFNRSFHSFIPVCGEQTQETGMCCSSEQLHPHLRGADKYCPSGRPVVIGSSPLTGSRPVLLRSSAPINRLIPAHGEINPLSITEVWKEEASSPPTGSEYWKNTAKTQYSHQSILIYGRNKKRISFFAHKKPPRREAYRPFCLAAARHLLQSIDDTGRGYTLIHSCEETPHPPFRCNGVTFSRYVDFGFNPSGLNSML